MKFYTYCHIRRDTGKIFYVGKGSNNRYRDIHNRSKWWKSIYNKTEVDFLILAYWETEEDAFSHEKLLISCIPNLCNLTDGGDGASGFRHSKESREKRSAALIKWHKENPEAAKSWANKRAPTLYTEERRKSLSDRRKGISVSEVTRKKISETSKGRKKPDNFGNIISQAMTEAWATSEFRERQKAGIVAARGRKVIDTVSGNIFITVTEAVKWLRLNGYPKMSTSYLRQIIKAGRVINNSKFEYMEDVCQK